jgi:hypothetical protein
MGRVGALSRRGARHGKKFQFLNSITLKRNAVKLQFLYGYSMHCNLSLCEKLVLLELKDFVGMQLNLKSFNEDYDMTG